MPNYYTLSSGNINDSKIFGVTTTTSETTAATACFSVLDNNNIIINSTVSDGIPIYGIALPVSSANINSNNSTVDITLQSSICSNTFTYYISSFYNDNIVDIPTEFITQNIHTLQFNTLFNTSSGDRISLKIKTSTPNILNLIGNIDCVDISNNRIPLLRSIPTQPAVNVSGRFIDSTSISLTNNSFYRDKTAFTYISTISSNNFTIEAWVYPLINSGGYNGTIFEIGSITSAGAEVAGKRIRLAQCMNSNNLGFIIPNNTSNADTTVISNTSIPLSTWSHISLVRNISSCFCYLNGTRVASATGVNFNFNNNSPSIRELRVGGAISITPLPFNGYISDLRVCANTALYTNNSFLLPSSPPTINQNTIFQIGTGINLNRSYINFLNDSLSSFEFQSDLNNFPLTASDINGVSTSVQFISASASNLNINYNTNFNFLTNNFTVESLIYFTTLPPVNKYVSIFSLGTAGTAAGLTCTISNSTMQLFCDGVMYGNVPHNLVAGSWFHIAWVRCNNTISCYTNNIKRGSFSLPISITTGNKVWIGRDSLSEKYLNGYISALKITNGSSIYTENIISNNFINDASPNTVLLFKSPHALSSNRFIYSTAPKLDDLHISNYITDINNSSLANIGIEANSITVYGNIYVHNNATFSLPYNKETSLYVYGNKGIIIHNNSYFNIGSIDTPVVSSIKSTLYLAEGININNGGYLNLYGSYKLPTAYLTVSTSPSVTNFRTTNTRLSTQWLSGDTLYIIPTATSIIDPAPKFDILQLTTFSNSSSFNTSSSSLYGHPFTTVIPTVVNLTRNIIIQPISSANKIYIRGVNNSNININNVFFNNIGSSLLNKNGIIIGTNQSGSFILNNCSISANNLNTTNSRVGKIQPSILSNICTDNEFSLYLPAGGTGYISPLFPSLPALSGDFTIDCWVYDLGENANASILTWYDGVNTYTHPGIRVYRDTNNRITLRYYSPVFITEISKTSRPNVFNTHTWNHISITCKNNFLNIWINGQDVGCGVGIADTYPYHLRALSAAATTSNYIRIGGETTNGGATHCFGGYIYDFRINNTEAVIPSLTPPLTSENLSTDIFRLSRNNIISDISSQKNNVLINGSCFMTNFSPITKNLNNIQIKDNILVQSIDTGIKFQNTNISNSVISGNYVLNCSKQNYIFNNINADNVIMQNNYATAPSTDNVESTYISNCISKNNSVIGGTVNYNCAATGVVVAGVNDAVIGNIICISGLREGIVLNSFNYLYDNTSFLNITSNFNDIGIKFINQQLLTEYEGLSAPVKLNIDNAVFIENDIAVEGYNIYGNLNNIYVLNNRVGGFYGTLSNNSTYFNNFTALQTKNNTHTNVSSGIPFQSLQATNTNSIVNTKIPGVEAFSIDVQAGPAIAARVPGTGPADSEERLLPYNNFSLEYWLYLENYPLADTPAYQNVTNVFHCPVGVNGYYNFGIDNKGYIKFYIRDGDYYGNSGRNDGSDVSPIYYTTTIIPLNTWVHLALTVDNDGIIYVHYNGTFIGRDTGPTAAGAAGTAPPPNLNATRDRLPLFYINYVDSKVLGNRASLAAKDNIHIGCSTTYPYGFSTANTSGSVMNRGFYFASKTLIANLAFHKYPRYATTNSITPTPSLSKIFYYSALLPYAKASGVNNNNSIYYINSSNGHTGEVKAGAGIVILNNNTKGSLHINNSLLSCTSSTTFNSTDMFIPLILDNNFTKLNISNTTLSLTSINQEFRPGCYFNPGFGAFRTSIVPVNNIIRGNYEINNCNFGTSAISALSSIFVQDSTKTLGLTHTNYNNLTGNYITYMSNGIISSDATTSISSLTTKPSERVTPKHPFKKIKSSSKFVAIGPETTSATISVQVHTSTLLDGQVYNGSNPRLILRANPAASIYNDIILATRTGAPGVFITLTASIPLALSDSVYEFYVDCDGTEGWINVDNWQAT